MGNFDFGVDKAFAPVLLETSNNTMVVNGTAFNIPTGRYWNYSGSSAHNPGSKEGLIDRIEQEMNSHLTDSYTLVSATPPGSALINSGLEFQNDDVNTFTFNFTDSNFTLDPRLLGFSGQEDIASDSPEDPDIKSKYSLWRVWQSHNLLGGIASKKERIPHKTAKRSGDDQSRARTQTLNQYDTRKFKYEYVLGAIVKENRADDEGSAANPPVPWRSASSFSGSLNRDYGDTHNAFEALWDWMTQPGAEGRPAQIVWMHDEGDTGQYLPDKDKEFLRFRGPDEGLDHPNELYEMRHTHGEIYDIEFEMQIISEEGYRQ